MKRQSYISLVMAVTLVLTSAAPGITASAQGSEDLSNAMEITLSEDHSLIPDAAKEAEGLLTQDKEVSIIVEVDEDSLIDEFLDEEDDDLDEYLASKEAMKAQKGINLSVEKVAKRVLKAVKGAELLYEYDTVFTGFAVKTTYGALDTIRSVKGVKNAYVSEEYAAPAATETKPDMISSGDMIYAAEATKDYGVAGDGMVVAVLDTGIDYNHVAFDEKKLSGVNVAYTKYSIAGKVNNLELDAEKVFRSLYDTSFDVNDVYQNLKVPFAYDYADNDLDPIPPKTEDHGTHVAGTIAGNCSEFKGIAYNAQVMSFKVFSDEGGGCTDAVLIASLDDAVKLGVDVINMSLGSSCGFVTDDNATLQQSYDAVKAAGISLEVAAGNEYGSSYGGNYGNLNLTSDPDEATVGNPSTLDAALSVAAMENTQLNYQTYIGFTDKEGQEAKCTYLDTGVEAGMPFSSLSGKEYKYVDCGLGTQDDFKKVKNLIKGNVALISRGEITFNEKIAYAAEAGAVGAIVYNNEAGTISMLIDQYYIPAVSIMQADGRKLLDAIDSKTGYGVFTYDAEKKASLENPSAGMMCEFTSIGPTPSLTLKPEITAPGGNIYSAYYVDEDGSSVSGLMSGTSMATPHMAGATALIRQYYQRKYPSMSKVELTKFINSMEMSTANPVIQDVGQTDGTAGTGTVYYSPRTQGAGLVNIKAAIDSGAYLTVKGQERPKAELGYNVDGTYSFETTIVNLDSKTKTYKLNGTVQAEDFVKDEYGYTYAAQKDIDITDAASIQFTGANMAEDGTVTVNANGKATIQVEVTLDKNSDTFKTLNEVYNNGFYVEGFVFATPVTGDDVELSLPYLGFYGDYANLPIFDATINDYFSGKDYPVCEMGCALTGFQSEFTLGMNYSALGLYGKYDFDSNKVYTSVNSVNGMTSFLVPYTYLKTNVSEMTYVYKTSSGKVIKTYSYKDLRKSTYSADLDGMVPTEMYIDAEDMSGYPVFTGYDEEGNLLPNGKYKVEITAKSALGGKPQKIELGFKVDNTAPTLQTYSLEDSKYVYVFVKGKDNASVQSLDLYYGEYATAAGYSALWKPDKSGKMVLKLKKSELPADFDVTALQVSIYDHALNCTTEKVADKYDLEAPKLTKAAVSKKGGIVLSWKKVKNAQGYKIYRSTSKNGKYEYLKSTTKLEYRNTKGLKHGKTYYYKVVAYVKDSGIVETGAYSAVKKVKFK
ncbi:MAG: S8 family serine peptidase [Lachnospiraceae bacterium]